MTIASTARKNQKKKVEPSSTKTKASPTAARGKSDGGLGCGKCRFSKRGCARCKARIGEGLIAGTKAQKAAIVAKKASREVAPRPEKKPQRDRNLKRKNVMSSGSPNKRAKRRDPAPSTPEAAPARPRCRQEEVGEPPRDSPKTVLHFSSRKPHGQERCFSKLSKFVRPVRAPMKPTSLFRETEAEATTTAAAEAETAVAANKPAPSMASGPASWEDPNWFDPRDPEVCNAVKNALHMSASPECSADGAPKVRGEEFRAVRAFLAGRIGTGTSGSLYVSGVPGSGKSHIVRRAISSSLGEVFGHKGGRRRSKVVEINCMTLRDPRRIFALLLEKGFGMECAGEAYERDMSFALTHLRKAASCGARARKGKPNSPGDMVVLVLDEVDHLYRCQGDVLYDLFSLAEMEGSRVVFVGIANSIDLTLRMLPHLHSIGVEPTMVNFRAYLHPELQQLMQDRLRTLTGPVFDPRALELCCGKVAATSGDMRRCLNAAMAALECHISQSRQKDREGVDGGAPGRRLVDLQHMSLALGRCLKLPLINGMRALPQHQQMILCSTALMREGEVALTTLYAKYVDLCRSSKISGLAFNEFENACTSLNDQGLISLVNKKKNLHSKALRLKVKLNDIVFALQGIRFFHNILSAS